MLSVVPVQCLGYATKKLLVESCYSTLRRWVYAKCRPGLCCSHMIMFRAFPTIFSAAALVV